MIADDDPRIRHDFGYKGERAEMERFIAPYPKLVALSAKIRHKTIAAWAAGDGETPDEDAWESGDPDNPGVVELIFGFQEQYATLTGALVDGFSEGGEYDYDSYFLSQGVCPGCWEGCIGQGGPICACEQRGALAAREWLMSQDEAVEEGWDWSTPDRPFAIPDVFVDLETGQLIRPGREGTRDPGPLRNDLSPQERDEAEDRILDALHAFGVPEHEPADDEDEEEPDHDDGPHAEPDEHRRAAERG